MMRYLISYTDYSVRFYVSSNDVLYDSSTEQRAGCGEMCSTPATTRCWRELWGQVCIYRVKSHSTLKIYFSVVWVAIFLCWLVWKKRYAHRRPPAAQMCGMNRKLTALYCNVRVTSEYFKHVFYFMCWLPYLRTCHSTGAVAGILFYGKVIPDILLAFRKNDLASEPNIGSSHVLSQGLEA